MRPSQIAAPDPAHALKCELAGEVLRSSGTLRLRVTGWSMLPTVMPGDTLLIERVSSDEVSEGDIVLFRRERRLFAHRVIVATDNAGEREFVTRGDGMPQSDPSGDKSELLGKVAFILRNGRVIKPGTNLSIGQRAVAAVVQRSDSAARVIVGLYGMRQSSKEPFLPCQS